MKLEKKPRICKNGHESNEYHWSNEKVICHCGQEMKEVKAEKKNLIGIRTDTKNRV